MGARVRRSYPSDMHKRGWLGVMIFLMACGGEGSGGAGPGGVGDGDGGAAAGAGSAEGGGGSQGNGAMVTVTSTTTGGGGAACTGTLALDPDCVPCADQACCLEQAACFDDVDCVVCLDMANPECAARAAYQDLDRCLQDHCSEDCHALTPPSPACEVPPVAPSGGACITITGGVQCNPMTNEGCDASLDEVCDSNGAGYSCFPPPPPSDKDLCEPCGQAAGGFCKSGMVCVGTCNALCCDDADCGDGAHCDKSHDQYAPAGICAAGAP